jgi:hypothetical protein
MCLACELPSTTEDWTEAVGGSETRARLRQVLASVLSAYGLSLRSAALTPGFQIATRSGRHVRVRTLDEVWAAAESLCGRSIDPLDPQFARADAGEK